MTITEKLNLNKDYIIKEYTNGKSQSKLGKEFDCNPSMIFFLLKENNIERRGRSKTWGHMDQYDEQIIEMFNSGHSAYKIGKTLNIPKITILRQLKKLGLSTSHLSTEREDKLINHTEAIIELYQQGKSLVEIAEIYNASDTSILQLLENNNIDRRDKIKYDIDLQYLLNKENPNMYYVLGFWYGDGNNKGNGIRIEITDKDIVEKIKAEFKYDGPITEKDYNDGKRKLQYSLNLNRTELSEQMTNLGCPPAKTYILKFPTQDIVDNKYMSNFLLGLFDAEGSVSKRYISFTGLDTFLFALIEKIKELTGIQFKYYKRKNQFGSAMLSRRNDIITFLTWLYCNKTLFGQRKRDRVKLFYGV